MRLSTDDFLDGKAGHLLAMTVLATAALAALHLEDNQLRSAELGLDFGLDYRAGNGRLAENGGVLVLGNQKDFAEINSLTSLALNAVNLKLLTRLDLFGFWRGGRLSAQSTLLFCLFQ